MNTPLVLPWPAWLTDNSEKAQDRLRALNEVELIQAWETAERFFSAHEGMGRARWRISCDEIMAYYEVRDVLIFWQAYYFRKIMEERRLAACMAAIRRGRRRKAA